MAKRTVPVTGRALLQRVNRALKKDMEVVKIPRSDQLRAELGDFYRLDLSRNLILEKDVDLEELGREIGALKEYEHVVSE